MRFLCLNLQKKVPSEVAEIFLKYSSRVQFRNKLQDDSHISLIFIDIAATSHLFSGETALLQSAIGLARRLCPEVTAAISDTAAGAQVFSSLHSSLHSSYICLPGEEMEKLGEQPLTSLVELEGLKDWEKVESIQQVISLFHILGLRKISQIYELQADAFRERWGKLGEVLWKRLHHVEKQVISPLNVNAPLSHYSHFDEPISLLSFLLYHVENNLSLLTDRMAGRGHFAQKIELTLHCEYSEEQHQVSIELTPPCRNQSLFMDLIEQKLSDLSLENPIRQIEIKVQSCPENIKQFGFFEPRTSDKDRLQRLVHLFRQKGVTTGFLKIRNDIFPESTFEISAQPEDFSPLRTSFDSSDGGIKKNVVYGEFSTPLPRPSQLLEQPLKVGRSFMRKMKPQFLEHSERLERQWWKSKDHEAETRDYRFALSQQGQLMWMYKEKQNYYLHGFCD